MNRLVILPVVLLSGCAMHLQRTYTTTDAEYPVVSVSAERQVARSYTADGTPVPVTAAQRKAVSKPEMTDDERRALRVFGWCSAADAATTIAALGRGFSEANPLLGHHPSPGLVVGAKVGFNVAARALVVHAGESWVPVVRATGWAQCAAAGWNVLLMAGVL